MPQDDLREQTEKIDQERRGALFTGASAALLALVPLVGKAAEPTSAASSATTASAATAVDRNDDDRIVPIYDEPGHHVVMQNGEMRVMRVMIRPGTSTLWHAQNLTFVNTIISGSHTVIARKGEGPGKHVEMVTGTVRFGDYQRSPIVDKVSNVGDTLIHQIAFEITALERGNYGPSDRSQASNFSVVLDKTRVRGWRLKLEPGEITQPYRQDGPGLRVVLSGARLIEKSPGEIGEQISLRHGDAMFTKPGLRTITNASEEPLELMEYELL